MLGFRPLGSGPLGSGAVADAPVSGFQSYWVQHNESIGNMKKNVASQIISAQMIAIADGSNQTTGTCNVAVEIDGVAGTGGTATHIANGKWEYAPIQADTNGDNLTFQFVITGAITVTKDIFTAFPQTVDNNVLAAGATGFAAIDTVVDTILSRVIGTIESGSHNPASTAQLGALTDWIDGGRLDSLLDAIPTTAMRGTDSALLASSAPTNFGDMSISVTTGLVDITQAAADKAWSTTSRILTASTNFNDVAATDIVSSGAITTSGGAVSTVTTVGTTTTNTDMRGTDSAATAANLATVDTNVDAILVDTSTTLPALIDDLAVKKNATFSNFEFLMVLTSDGRTPATGLTVTGQRSINGGAFVGVTGTIAEVSNGIYQFDAVAADTNGDVITWRFSSATADDTFVTFKTVA